MVTPDERPRSTSWSRYIEGQKTSELTKNGATWADEVNELAERFDVWETVVHYALDLSAPWDLHFYSDCHGCSQTCSDGVCHHRAPPVVCESDRALLA